MDLGFMSSPFKLWSIVFVVLPACSDDASFVKTPGADGNQSASGGSSAHQDASASGEVAGASGLGGPTGRHNALASGGVAGASGVGGSGGRSNTSASGGVAGANG